MKQVRESAQAKNCGYFFGWKYEQEGTRDFTLALLLSIQGCCGQCHYDGWGRITAPNLVLALLKSVRKKMVCESFECKRHE